MFTARYADIVRMYRANKHRSLSVGDFVLVTTPPQDRHEGPYGKPSHVGYSCERIGWALRAVEDWPEDARFYVEDQG